MPRPHLFRPLAAGLLTLCSVATAAAAVPVERVRQLAEREQAPLLRTLEQLVGLESGSRDLAGLEQIARMLADRLAALGGRVERVAPSPEIQRMSDTPAQVGGSVQATFTGTGTRTILLLAHMDTVYPRGTLARQPFRIAGDRAYGVGIADNKHGNAVILHVLALLQALDFRGYRTITVLINGDEELGSPGSRQILTRLGAEHDVVLSFDGPIGPDHLLLATSGIAAATLRVQGRGSHAGIAPERGVNALYELSHQLLQLRDLSEPDRGLKVNWTMAQAGVTRNMIPPEATASADIRVLRVEDYDRIERTLRARITRKLLPEAVVSLDFERRRPPLEATAASRKLATRAQAIYRELGRDLTVQDRPEGGGTDAAFAALQARGPVVENFGLQAFGAHSTNDEYVLISSIVPRLYLATRLIMELERGD